ncbi:SUKH-4 family immunity protein [Streptomyces sp. 16-176A]|uniref:SUKH-4 family immunity protein n=1 Tax=Streptomyces sp. 16-176A TaxID=2530458 RepID=UPI00345D5325
MLFDVCRGRLVRVFGEGRVPTVPAGAFPPAAADTEGARVLRTVGVPDGTVLLRQPGEDDGLLPLVQDVVSVEDLEGFEGFEDAVGGVGGWPVIGWLLHAHLVLDPASGTVYALDPDEETVRGLHTDVSSLVEVAFRFQRLLEEFAFGGDHIDGDGEDADFERLEGEVERVREEIGRVDPLPFRDEETVWSVVADEIAMGQRFPGDSPGARSLYG